MATIGADALTFRDMSSGLKGDKTFDHEIVDIVAETNEMLDDIVWTQANDGSSDRTTIRTGLPEAVWHGFYEGIQASKGQKQQIVNTAGRASTLLEIDADLYDHGDAAARAALIRDEVGAHSEALGQEVATALIYGDLKTEVRKINGLGPVYSEIGSKGDDDAVSSHFVFNGSATVPAANTLGLRSIWLANWGGNTMRGFYPKGTSAGLMRGKFSDTWVTEDGNKRRRIYLQQFDWYPGLAVRDFRYGGRIANINQSALTSSDADAKRLLSTIDQLEARVRYSANSRRVWYMSRLMWEALLVIFGNATRSNAVKYAEVDQRRRVPTLFDVPVRINDALNVNEAVIPLAT